MYLIGVITSCNGLLAGLSGPLVRSSGVLCDWRYQTNTPYDLYSQLYFSSFVGVRGDCYDRFILRLREILESLYLLLQLFQYLTYFTKYIYNRNTLVSTISMFREWCTATTFGQTLQCSFVEAGKGLFGVSLYLYKNATLKCYFRSPAFFNLQSIVKLASGVYLSDLTALLGTLDIVFGEVDRKSVV